MTATPSPRAESLRSLFGYLAGSPSPYHAVANAAATLEQAGFRPLEEAESWSDVTGAGYIVRGGALVAWRCPQGLPAHAGFRIVGAHTDSPNLRLKPHPDTASVGWRQLAVEVYGGALLNSWLDRDLGLSGRLVLRSGETVLVRLDQPLARVPQLAIHLDRDVNDRGLVLDKQLHLAPIWGLGSEAEGGLARFVAEAVPGLHARDIAASDLMFHDLTPPSLLGAAQELIASARLDNLCSAWAAVAALADGPGDVNDVEHISVVCLFDHEEVGSESATGAAGPLLETVIDRLVLARAGGAEDRHRALACSSCISADMAHAVHPNYPERHEPGHRPLPNAGPVLKVNANQRYATDAETATIFTRACQAAEVPWQVFVSRSSMPCGSTIGPVTAARLGIATVDVGCAQLSMHSARELCGVDDPHWLAAALTAYLAG
jgi:aspartyl aminopeptidase